MHPAFNRKVHNIRTTKNTQSDVAKQSCQILQSKVTYILSESTNQPVHIQARRTDEEGAFLSVTFSHIAE